MNDDKNGAKISIVTVCFNSAATIRDTLESIAAQSYRNIEYIIVDGGSTDATLDIVKEYSHIVDRLIAEPDDGIYDAMNKGISLASGNIIGFLNADDFFSSEFSVQKIILEFNKNANLDIVYGDVSFVRENNVNEVVRYYRSVKLSINNLRIGLMPAHPATYVKKHIFASVGGFSQSFKIASDFDFFVRIAKLDSCSYFRINESIVTMRLGGVSTSGAKSTLLLNREIIKILRNHSIFSSACFLLLKVPYKLLELSLFKRV